VMRNFIAEFAVETVKQLKRQDSSRGHWH